MGWRRHGRPVSDKTFKYLGQAFKAQVKPSARKFVLVALADCANKAGRSWPCTKELMDKTGLDRKTVLKHTTALAAEGWIVDTGDRVGRTGSVRIWGMAIEETSAKLASEETQSSPINGTAKQSQKRYTLKSGSGPKNGPKRSQKRDTEPTEPLFKEKSKPKKKKPPREEILANQNQVSLDLITRFIKHRREIGHPASDKAVKLAIGDFRSCIEQGLAASVEECMDKLDATTWRTLKPEYINGKNQKQNPKHGGAGDRFASFDPLDDWGDDQFGGLQLVRR